MQTALTKLLNVRVPVVLAPMAGASGGELAAGVMKGGGFGFIGHAPWDKLEKEIEIARTQLGVKAGEPLPFGIGVIGFQIEAPFMTPSAAHTFLRNIVTARPASIWLSFARELKSHLEFIKQVEKEQGIQQAGSKIMVMVGTLELAKEVVSWGLVDVLVAQGTEAGGHANTHSTGHPTHLLLQTFSEHLSTLPSPPILLSAGGLMTGRDLVSILPYSSGMVLGTAFLASPECLYSPAHKARIIAATGAEDTVRTLVFDNARGTTEGFGEKVDGRALRNLMTVEAEKGEKVDVLNERYDVALKEGPASEKAMERIVVWAGTGVGQVKEALPAAQVVQNIEKEAKVAFEALAKTFGAKL